MLCALCACLPACQPAPPAHLCVCMCGATTRFVLPVMLGFVRQLSDLRFPGASGSYQPITLGGLTLIARRWVGSWGGEGGTRQPIHGRCHESYLSRLPAAFVFY